MSYKEAISVSTIKTSVFHAGNDIDEFLIAHLKGAALENKVLAITTKIISLAENRLVKKNSVSKAELVKSEADNYLGSGNHGIELTIHQGILIPSAGIDESNSESGDYILYPEAPFASAEKIYEKLKKHFQLKSFGLILTDSHTTPLRRGVTGIALAHWGLKATRSLVGQEDIFHKPLKFTHVNVVDSLASMAVYAMGEANDCTPLAIIEGSGAEFTTQTNADEIQIPAEHDLYAPLLLK